MTSAQTTRTQDDEHVHNLENLVAILNKMMAPSLRAIGSFTAFWDWHTIGYQIVARFVPSVFNPRMLCPMIVTDMHKNTATVGRKNAKKRPACEALPAPLLTVCDRP